jgi:pyridoxamine 5'-phosphate oxidase
MQQFRIWWEEALKSQVLEANAMNVSTLNAHQRPSSRIVLLKGLDHGFIFYTNYESRKGKEIAHFPFVALNFFWPELERQVRVEGKVEKTDAQTSDEYFLSRPKSSQIGAWASPQSQVIPDRTFLEKRENEINIKFNQDSLFRPPHWGGYRVIPDYLEFWQGRASRLHDRIVFETGTEGSWSKKRLAP